MTELENEYQSADLFPLFKNRVLPKSRPEYRSYLEWLGMSSDQVDPLVILGRSGGLRGTDTLAIYPAPSRDSQKLYRLTFFCHGMRYMAKSSEEAIHNLTTGDKLYPMHDMQNEFDPNALALRTSDPTRMIGYCPRFFAEDFRTLLKKRLKDARISVLRVNLDAPIDFRLLCEFQSPWPDKFTPCGADEYQPLVKPRSRNAKARQKNKGRLKHP